MIFDFEKGSRVMTESSDIAEIIIADELSRYLSESEMQEFLQSSECQALEEAGVLRKKTLVRLGRQDDLARRTKLAALQLAKNANDPLIKILSKIRRKEKEIVRKIMKRHKMEAMRHAKVAQKEYIKKVPMLKKIKSAMPFTK